MKDRDDHWLARPSTIKLLWRVFVVVLAVTVILQFVVPVKGYFGIDGWFGFGAVYGFVACAAMVIVAKGLGLFVKRDDDYYDGDGNA